jgi:hypothetical protein
VPEVQGKRGREGTLASTESGLFLSFTRSFFQCVGMALPEIRAGANTQFSTQIFERADVPRYHSMKLEKTVSGAPRMSRDRASIPGAMCDGN